MSDIPIKYGFPLFCKIRPMGYLLKNDSIRVADIWAFWNYMIRKNFARVEEKTFMFSLLEQAKYFYETAKLAPLKSQPLLYYYSFLNLSKIIINMFFYHGDRVEYYHGLETKTLNTTTLRNAKVSLLKMDPSKNKYSVAYELMTSMGCNLPTIPPKKEYEVKRLLQDCVGVHRTYSEIYNVAEHFYRIKDLQLERLGKVLKCTSILTKTDASIVPLLTNKGYNIIPMYDKDGAIVSYSWQEEWNMLKYNVAHIDYYMLSQILYKKGLWTYSDGNEYRMFISDTHTELTSECIIYCLMFFFGSITRYNPNIFDSLLTDRDYWMISEFLKTQPSQFLLLVTSKAIGHALLKPRTSDILS